MLNFVVSAVPADGLAPLGARSSAGTVMTKSGYWYQYPHVLMQFRNCVHANRSMWHHVIALTSHEQHGISEIMSFWCHRRSIASQNTSNLIVTSKLCSDRLTIKKMSQLCIVGPLCVKDQHFRVMASNVDIVSMWWYHHVMCPWCCVIS